MNSPTTEEQQWMDSMELFIKEQKLSIEMHVKNIAALKEDMRLQGLIVETMEKRKYHDVQRLGNAENLLKKYKDENGFEKWRIVLDANKRRRSAVVRKKIIIIKKL